MKRLYLSLPDYGNLNDPECPEYFRVIAAISPRVYGDEHEYVSAKDIQPLMRAVQNALRNIEDAEDFHALSKALQELEAGK